MKADTEQKLRRIVSAACFLAAALVGGTTVALIYQGLDGNYRPTGWIVFILLFLIAVCVR